MPSSPLLRYALAGAFAILTALIVCIIPACLAKPEAVPNGTRTTLNVAYVPGGGVRQQMDVYAHPNPDAPVLVWIHGGGWLGGSKERCPLLGLMAQGYSVVSINYRYSFSTNSKDGKSNKGEPEVHTFPAQLQDCKAAIRYIRAHAKELGLNTKRIGAVGASAGGHLVALLGVTGTIRTFDVGENLDQSSAVDLVVNAVGPTDIFWYADYSNKDVQYMADKLIGGPIKDNRARADAASPVHYVKPGAAIPPILNLYGGKDPLVPAEQGRLFDKALRDAGASSTLIVNPDTGHDLSPAAAIAAWAFIRKHLPPAAAAATPGSSAK
ncbi:esterase [Verrucomicrobia bacterium LW23]|nr:esterase [Verrucomicrobia bacterium LW23]